LSHLKKARNSQSQPEISQQTWTICHETVATVGTGIWVASHADFLFTFRNKKSEKQSRKDRVLLRQDETRLVMSKI
jgi:hypothetical protein